ncbi:hypothetical protein, partial [Escherichia coli]
DKPQFFRARAFFAPERGHNAFCDSLWCASFHNKTPVLTGHTKMVLKKSEKFVEFDSFWLIFDNGFFDKQNMHQKQKVAITNLETIFLF